MTDSTSIGGYLLRRLEQEGLGHLFGVPGDYCLRFYDLLVRSPIVHVGTTREDTAAFAADGYARCRGIGALAVTYGVGALNVVNSVAGAYAESSPVVVISGAPGVREQQEDPLIHHRFGPFSFQREIFARITCAQEVLADPYTAFRQIDRALEALGRERRPIYLELPRDRVDSAGFEVPAEPAPPAASDPEGLAEAVEETAARLAAAHSPVLVAGQEVQRRGLQDALIGFIRRTRLPVAATLTGKSVVGERHPAYLGVYEGALGGETARLAVEDSDLVLMLGVTLNDVDLGVYTAKLDPDRLIRASGGEVIIRHHRYPRVPLRDFLEGLDRTVPELEFGWPAEFVLPPLADFPAPGRPMTVARLIERLNRALTPHMLVVADTGDCLFSALELRVHERSEFLASAFYTTMGFAVPAALGAQVARPELRPLVLVGDGAFQMTGTELSTLARMGSAAIVVVFNNGGYGTERFILDGPFNDIATWRFHRLGELIPGVQGFEAATEEAFELALGSALARTDGPSLIEVRLARDDASPAMRRLASHLGRRVQG
jgi:indolepyruvate decarboxylase